MSTNPPCPECGSKNVSIGRYGKFVCNRCGRKWYGDKSSIKPHVTFVKKLATDETDGYSESLRDNSRDNSEADGLMTLDEEDILFPPE